MNKDSGITLIVGAGLTGLTAASLMARAGTRCLLVESQDRVGGLCRSLTVDDVPFDLGPHVLFDNPEAAAERFIFETLRGVPLISHRFAFAMHAGGRYWRFPNHVDFLFYPWAIKKHFLKFLLKKPPLPPGEISVARELTDKSGPEFYALLFEGTMRKKTLLPPEELHRDWLIRVDRTVRNELEPFVYRSKFKTIKAIMGKLRQSYFYPRDGFEVLPRKIWENYRAAGGETILSVRNVTLDVRAGRVAAAHVDGAVFPVRNVVWTAPVTALNVALKADVPKLPCVDILLLFLTYNRTKRVPRPYVYTYHPDPNLLFNRVYYPESIFRALSQPGKEGLCLEYAIDETMRGMSRQALFDRAAGDVAKLGLYPASALRCVEAMELPGSMPVYPLDYKTRLRASMAPAHAISNLHGVGRQGGFYFCLTPGAVGQGIKIAEHLLKSKDTA